MMWIRSLPWCNILYVWIFSAALNSRAEAELQLVHVLFRHGQRTPADTYPKDPYIKNSLTPVGWGQLTNYGKLAQYSQGQYLRERYDNFLGDIYSSDIFFVQTTDVDRTKMSAQVTLAGLWPPAPAQQWNPNLLWQPIPLHSEPLNEDSLLLVRLPCPNYYYLRDQVKASEEVQHILNKYNASQLYEILQEHTGNKFDDPEDVQSLYSTLKAEVDFNLTLPEWTREIYPEQLLPLTIFSFILNVYNSELQMLKGGPLLKKIINDIQAKVNETSSSSNYKMIMYAGHDSTISNLLSALKVWDPQIPSYGIMVLIELHQDTETNLHDVRIFLRNTTSHEPYPLTLPGCKTSCPVEDFYNLTSSVIPQNWKESCKVNELNYIPPSVPPP